MRAAILLAALALAACDTPPTPPKEAIDQCMRREIFRECMAALPKGPERTATSNDWDEVVDSCFTVATRSSYRAPDQVKAECRADNR